MPWRLAICVGALAALLACIQSLPVAAQTAASSSGHFESGGLALDLSLNGSEPGAGAFVSGTDAAVHIAVTDARTGAPIRGARPRAWFSAMRAGTAEAEASCEDKIRVLLRGSLTSRADVDLNAYSLVTLNHDQTVTFINPQIALNVTKLESIVVLPAQGVDWALSKNQATLFVTMPDADAVAVIDTGTRRIDATLPTGEGSRPQRIAMAPDGRSALVALDGSGEVAAIDTARRSISGRVKVGAGLHSMAFGADSRQAYVANSSDDTVSIVEMAPLRKTADLKVGATPVALAYGSAGHVLYVAGLNADQLSVIDTDRQDLAAAIPIGSGAVRVEFEPTGRFALVLRQFASSVAIVDSATGRVTATAAVTEEPDQVAFTPRYAYIRGLKSEKFTLLDLNDVRAGALSPVDIQAGTLPAVAAPQQIGPASMIVATPDGNAAMIANTADAMVYYYVEGMMAPMGTFSTYKRMPRAVALLDHSLSETALGAYAATVRLPAPGRYAIPVFVDQPRLVTCYQVTVAPSENGPPADPAAELRVERLAAAAPFIAGSPAMIAIRLWDAKTGEPIGALRDLRALVVEDAGVGQQHAAVTEQEAGTYALTLTLAQPGSYRILLSAPSRKLRPRDLPPLRIGVENSRQSAASP